MTPPVPEPSGVRVVICTHRSRNEVLGALESCLSEGLSEAQLTVVDNDSQDGTLDLIRARHPGVRALAMEANLGFGAAVNRGARQAGGETLLILNPDAELRSGALARMLSALSADPRRGAVSPRILRPDGRLDPACRRSFPDPLVAFWRLSGLARAFPQSARLGAYNLTHVPPDRPQVIDAGTGACLLIRGPLFLELGGFDEGYFMYGEDLELCWQIAARGQQVWYEPSAIVVHRKGASSEQAALRMLVEFHRSMWRFYRLHYARGAQAWLAPLVGAGIGGRLLALLAVNVLRRRPRVSP